ncbi:hypothetical protein [Persicirhabdus sediminis]|uniref:hypothetical protein n=1 Tax=Persicirhabdus sediminis TaxID=454144 RepID=UPI001F1629AE|nr:hypothetical protein [Persicirhabdus sediminis]
MGQLLRDANTRAHQRANRRLGRRHGLTSMRAAIDGLSIYDEIETLQWPARLMRWLFALALLPLCAITSMTLFTINEIGQQDASYWLQLLKSREFLFFFTGMFLMGSWFFSKLLENFFLYLYVLGHELTHALTVYLCLGHVSSIKVSTDGGYIMTNKSNLFISLSPYFVPFWSVVVMIIAALIGHFTSFRYQEELLYFAIGGSWAFHMLWTIWMIPRDQPDLKENGTFFSLVIIYLANVSVILCMMVLASSILTWSNVLNHWLNQGQLFYSMSERVFTRVISLF